MPAGSSIDVNAEQPEKVIAPRLTGPAGSVIDVNDEQPSKSERAPLTQGGVVYYFSCL